MILLATCVIVLIVVLYLIRKPNYEIVHFGGRNWHVLAKFSNTKEAAKYLSDLNDKIIVLLRSLKKRYRIDDPTYKVGDVLATNVDRKFVEVLLDNYNSDKIFESNPLSSVDTSYTMNKGASMHFCLRDRENLNEFIEPNLMMFVAIHELGHVANYISWGHEMQFWEVFKFLLFEAVEAKIYTAENYGTSNRNYCGLNVTYSPLYDAGVRDIRNIN